MTDSSPHQQSEISAQKNASYFLDHAERYQQHVETLDTYQIMRAHIDSAVEGLASLLDVGNGGVFDYSTELVGTIIGLDLFLDKIPADTVLPGNVKLQAGDALRMPFADESFDGVLMVMLLHHLFGETAAKSLQNVERALDEAVRVLRPGGKLIIVESCVPTWFYAFERAVFRSAAWVIHRTIAHPATLQYPAPLLAALMGARTRGDVGVTKIPVGKFLLQYGFRFPAALTPTRPYILTAAKSG
jgi:SAM-dependent methyltransferase